MARILTWPRVAVVVCVLALLALLGSKWWAYVAPAAPTPVAEEAVARARAAAPTLRIVEPLSLEEYDRGFFGPAWQPVEPQPCDTRNTVLSAWLSDVVLTAEQPCSVASGWFIDPYTGHYIEFIRGPATSREVHVDHIVALADAWSKGASQWSAPSAQAFANDPLNLLPTQGWVNEEKGALDASLWVPPNRGFHCSFAVTQVLVKEKYDLGVSDAEIAELLTALDSCP